MTRILVFLTATLAAFLAAAYAAKVLSESFIRFRTNHGLVAVLVFAASLLGFTIWAGGKRGGFEPVKSLPAMNEKIVAMRDTQMPGPTLHGYYAPTNFEADASVFVRPADAETPMLWQNHSVCDDFQPVTPEHVAGICGVVTTQQYGFLSPEEIGSEYNAYAPLYATNSLIRGISDFWVLTNECSQTFVWKDIAFNRDPSNLVSFAVQLYDWGDVDFVYGNIPANGFSAFIKRDDEIFDMAGLCASGHTVRIEKNLEQNTDWWLENYPEICSTNEMGELLFDYDTNEWYMVEFHFVLEEDECKRSLPCNTPKRSITESDNYVQVDVSVNLGEAHLKIYRNQNNICGGCILGRGQYSDTLKAMFEYGSRGKVVASWLRDVDPNSEGRIKNVSVDSKYGVQCTRLSSRSFELLRPITMRIDNSAPQGAGYMNLSASISPAISGGSFSWSATGDLRLMSSSGPNVDVVADGDGGGIVNCLWRKGDISATGAVSVASGELAVVPGSGYLELSFEHPVAFFESWHLGTNGETVAASAPYAEMCCSYRGMVPGTLTIDLAPFQSDTATLFSDGQPVSLPATYSLSGAQTLTFTVASSQHSSTEDGVGFVAEFETVGNETYSSSASVTFVEVKVEAAEIFPDDGPRHIFGPTETIKVTVDPHGEGTGESTFGPMLAVTNAVLSVSLGAANYSFPVKVIGPSGFIATSPRPIDLSVSTNLNFTPALEGQIGASFMVDLHYLPDFVSFAGVDVTEGEAAPSGVWGYFASHPDAVTSHDASHGAGATVPILNGNSGGHDNVGYSVGSLAQPLSAGGWHWDIPVYWSVPGSSATNRFMTNVQTFELSPNGDFTVGKFGCSAIRGTNGVQQISGGGN